MRTDSQSAINIVKNPVHQHVDVDRQLISERAASGVIEVTYVPSAEQTADLFTKATSQEVLEYLKNKLDFYNA